MLSQLGPLFKTKFREAESNDTRQHIPHDERDKGRRKREEENAKEETSDLWEDNTSVSVVALRAFLIDFIKTIPEAQDISLVPDEPKSQKQRPPERQRPTNTHNAKAVRAYQTMAEHASTPIKQEETTKRNNDPTADKIKSQELRDIYDLIQDLKILENRGLQNLNIEKADSFVLSLKNAVAKQLGQM